MGQRFSFTGNHEWKYDCTISHFIIMMTISASLDLLCIIVCNIFPLVIYVEKVSFSFCIYIMLHWSQTFCGCQIYEFKSPNFLVYLIIPTWQPHTSTLRKKRIMSWKYRSWTLTLSVEIFCSNKCNTASLFSFTWSSTLFAATIFLRKPCKSGKFSNSDYMLKKKKEETIIVIRDFKKILKKIIFWVK